MRIEIGDGVRLYVDVDGLGIVPVDGQMVKRPTLLLLHGGPGLDHSSYKLGMHEMSDVAQVVMYDHRGNGRSDRRTPDEWNLDTWADDVVRLCDALGIEKPIVLGNSFGGFVAQRYLARFNRCCVDAQTSLTFIDDRTQDFGPTLRGHRIDSDHRTSTVALIDAYSQTAYAKHVTYPRVFRKWEVVCRFDQKVWAKSLDVEIGADGIAEFRDRLRRD